MDLLIRTICYKKVFLWAIFAVQLILIATVILIFGSLNTNYFFEIDENVKFVKNNSVIGIPIGREPFRSNRISPTHKNGDFFKEFINTSLAGDSLCFRDGVESVDNSICKCKFDYHGKDCGQPEILWRAFMTSKIPLNLSSTRREPHKIIYFIRTTTISMETLKIQIMELNGIVDLFVLCELGSTTRDQSFHLNVTEFLKQLSGKISVLHDNKCTPKNVYKKFRRGVGLEKGITADDVVLFSESDEILNWRVVKYFKWYDNWPQPVRFRLKYTVYGYYWQHPLNTIIGSMACQIRILDETFKGDPIRMMSTGKTGMIIGDLNYVGGKGQCLNVRFSSQSCRSDDTILYSKSVEKEQFSTLEIHKLSFILSE